MGAPESDDPIPVFRAKRRKIEHKRVRLQDDDAAIAAQSSASASQPSHLEAANPNEDSESQSIESTPTIKEILRMRKRPQHHLRDVARRTVQKAPSSSALIVPEAQTSSNPYTDRFIAQTGQVVDRDDEQMTAYIEAKMAEKNYQQYGWPIPKHVATQLALKPPTINNTRPPVLSEPIVTSNGDTRENNLNPEQERRFTAGTGKLQEVDLGPSMWARQDKSVAGGQQKKPPKRWRGQKEKTEDDLRRDMMVETVLREARLEFYEETPAPTVPTNAEADGTTDDAMAERFQREYLESIEEQRKPPPPPGPKGVKEQAKGPKLGGSRSARAAMRLQEEQAAKNKK